MTQKVFSLNEESFEKTIEVLSQLVPNLRNHYNGAVERFSTLSSEWDDEDYHNFMKSLKGIENQLNNIDYNTAQIINEVNRKLELIRTRHNIQM